MTKLSRNDLPSPPKSQQRDAMVTAFDAACESDTEWKRLCNAAIRQQIAEGLIVFTDGKIQLTKKGFDNVERMQ